MNTLSKFSAIMAVLALVGCSQNEASKTAATDELPETTLPQEVILEEEQTPAEAAEAEEAEELSEEILEIVKTELVIIDDEAIPEDDVKTQEEMEETETAFGSSDFSSPDDDVTVVRDHKDEVVAPRNQQDNNDPDTIYTVVEDAPQFPGGLEAMYQWMAENMRYPEVAAQNGVQGRVTVQFVIEKDGSIGEVKIVRGRDKNLDAEAVRLVKSMPKFTPGKMNGQTVRTWFTLPVNFKLRN